MFTILDNAGRDITYMLSPKLRVLFLYILLNSVGKRGGLSSDMNKIFWPDKPDSNVKNLKGVAMNHLRKILQDVDGIELVFRNGYFCGASSYLLSNPISSIIINRRWNL